MEEVLVSLLLIGLPTRLPSLGNTTYTSGIPCPVFLLSPWSASHSQARAPTDQGPPAAPRDARRALPSLILTSGRLGGCGQPRPHLTGDGAKLGDECLRQPYSRVSCSNVWHPQAGPATAGPPPGLASLTSGTPRGTPSTAQAAGGTWLEGQGSVPKGAGSHSCQAPIPICGGGCPGLPQPVLGSVSTCPPPGSCTCPPPPRDLPSGAAPACGSGYRRESPRPSQVTSQTASRGPQLCNPSNWNQQPPRAWPCLGQRSHCALRSGETGGTRDTVFCCP